MSVQNRDGLILLGALGRNGMVVAGADPETAGTLAEAVFKD